MKVRAKSKKEMETHLKLFDAFVKVSIQTVLFSLHDDNKCIHIVFFPLQMGFIFIIQYFCAASCSRIKGFGLIIYHFTVDSPMMSAWKHLLFLCVCAKSRILNFVVHKQHINVVTGRNFALHLLFTQKV